MESKINYTEDINTYNLTINEKNIRQTNKERIAILEEIKTLLREQNSNVDESIAAFLTNDLHRWHAIDEMFDKYDEEVKKEICEKEKTHKNYSKSNLWYRKI